MTGQRDFDSRAATWDEEPRRLKLARDVAQGIIDAVHPDTTMDAMDFGCGTGLITLYLQPHVRTIDGVDSSKGMLEILEKKVGEQCLENVRPLYCDLQQGARPEGPYHLIVSSMTMHHVPNLAPLFRLFHELLLPGGTLCLADLDTEDGTFHDDRTGIVHFGFARDQVKELLADAGFTGLRDSTAAVIQKGPTERPREYPVFLIRAVKPA